MGAVTPGLHTELRIDIPEVACRRTKWTFRRPASGITPIKERGGQSTFGVFRAQNDAWLLRPRFFDQSELIKTDTDRQYLGPSHFSLAGGYSFRKGYRKRTMTGVGGSSELSESGGWWLQKHVQAGGSWASARLPADEAAYPAPAATSLFAGYPVDRVAISKRSWPENTPFLLKWFSSTEWNDTDTVLRFYFGGQTELENSALRGGEWCISLRGSGDGILYEREPDEWKIRHMFPWGGAAGGRANIASIGIIPYASNRIFLVLPQGLLMPLGGFTLFSALAATLWTPLAQKLGGSSTLYREPDDPDGHRHIRWASGAGPVRLDRHRVEGRLPCSVIRGLYLETGTLVDGLLTIPGMVSAGDVLRCNVDAWLPPGTDISVALYRADTNTEVIPITPGEFKWEVENTREYFLRFTLHAARDGDSDEFIHTPVIFGYEVTIDGNFVYVPANTVYCRDVNSASIFGPSSDGSGDGARLVVEDLYDRSHVMRLKDRIRSTVSLVRPGSGELVTHLCEGEITQARTSRPVQHEEFPGEWRSYEVNISSLYRRLDEIFSEHLVEFTDSRTSPSPLTRDDGTPMPWKITDAIRHLLDLAGVPADEMDVPDFPIRFWPNPQGEDGYVIQPGGVFGRVAQDLVRNFLGMVLLRDPNAGSRGMWRVIPNPSPTSTNYLLDLYTRDAPVTPGAAPWVAGSYPERATFFIREGGSVHYHRWVQAPIANSIRVYGQASGDEANGSHLYLAQMENRESIFNPNSPDYVGRYIPLVIYDPMLHTRDACNWVCRQLFERLAFRRIWFEGQAPLTLVTDPLDPYQVRPRLPRVNDLVRVNGFPAVVETCGADYTSARVMKMTIRGRYLDRIPDTMP